MIGSLLFAAAAVFQSAGDPHSAAPSATLGERPPVEAGQSAYAALSEVVSMLLSDQNTDWSKVDIDSLRTHLVDMDNVTLRTQVVTEKRTDGALFRVTGQGDLAGSIQRMVSGHFTMMDLSKDWKFKSDPLPNGAVVTVTSDKPAEVQRIQALGFFGILTLGAHHQQHHVMMARGGMRH